LKQLNRRDGFSPSPPRLVFTHIFFAGYRMCHKTFTKWGRTGHRALRECRLPLPEGCGGVQETTHFGRFSGGHTVSSGGLMGHAQPPREERVGERRPIPFRFMGSPLSRLRMKWDHEPFGSWGGVASRFRSPLVTMQKNPNGWKPFPSSILNPLSSILHAAPTAPAPYGHFGACHPSGCGWWS
jgi:hypothetical protein